MTIEPIGIVDSVPCAYCAAEVVVVEQVEDGTRVRYGLNGTLTDYFTPSESKRSECWVCSPDLKPGALPEVPESPTAAREASPSVDGGTTG